MAMMDNRNFLISHIRNSFITSDDTGMCEMIIDTEEHDKHKGASSYSDSAMESSENELSHSYDILPDMDFGAHRRRSNTAVRLERMKKEKRSQVKVKQRTWKDSDTKYNGRSYYKMSHVMIKPVFGYSDQVKHQLDSSAIEDG